jgi:hypothetical protein
VNPAVLYLHPYNHVLPDAVPVGAIAAVNLLPGKAIGRFAAEVTAEDLDRARVILVDAHWGFALAPLVGMLAEIRRRAPHARVVVGGLAADYYHEILHPRVAADYVVRGDVGASFRVLVDHLLRREPPPPLPGIWSGEGPSLAPAPLTQEEFDRLDWISMEWFPTLRCRVEAVHARHRREYRDRSDSPPLLPVVRGCVRRCRFCFGAFQERIYGSRLLTRSPESLLRDLATIEADPALAFASLYFCDASFLPPYADALAGRRFELDAFVFCCGAADPEILARLRTAFAGRVAVSIIQPADLEPLRRDPPPEETAAAFAALLQSTRRADLAAVTAYHVGPADPLVRPAASGAPVRLASAADWLVARPGAVSGVSDGDLDGQLRELLQGGRRTAAALLLRALVPALRAVPALVVDPGDRQHPRNEGLCDAFELRLVDLGVDNLLRRRFYGFEDLRLQWALTPAPGPAGAAWSAPSRALDGACEWEFGLTGYRWRGSAVIDEGAERGLAPLPSVVGPPAGPVSMADWPLARLPSIGLPAGSRRTVEAGGRVTTDGVVLWVRDGVDLVERHLTAPRVPGPSDGGDERGPGGRPGSFRGGMLRSLLDRRGAAPEPPPGIDPWLRQRSVWRAVEQLAAAQPLPAPVTVELQLGTECNLACPECISHPLPGPGRFEPARATAIAGELVALGVRCVVLSGGGEPLLHPAAGAVLRRLAEGGVAVALVTNGTLLHDHLDAVAETAARVRVSVDAATPHTHGRFRPRRGGGESFGQVISNLGALAHVMRGQLTFSFLVISRRDATTGAVESNAGEIVEAARLARDVGCHAFDVNLAFDQRPWIDPAHLAVAGTLVAQLARLRELDRPEFRVCVGDLVAAVAAGGADPTPPTRSYARCLAAEIRAVVAPGGVFLCPRHMASPAARYGDPASTAIAEIWASSARAAARAALDARQHCAGACMSMGLNERLLAAVEEARRGRRVELLPDTDLFL